MAAKIKELEERVSELEETIEEAVIILDDQGLAESDRIDQALEILDDDEDDDDSTDED